MWLLPTASPGNIDWQLIVPRQQAFTNANWIPIIKPGNCGWIYVFMVGAGGGGSGGATGAAGTARAGGGAGSCGMQTMFIMPWALLPDVIWATAGLGGAGGAAALGSGGGGGHSVIQIEPINSIHANYQIALAGGANGTSGVTGGSGWAASTSVSMWARGPISSVQAPSSPNGGASTGAAGVNSSPVGPISTGASGGGTPTANTNFAGGGMGALFNTGPGHIIASTQGSGGDGGGTAGGGAGKNGKELGRGANPLDFVLTGNSTVQQFFGGCGGGTNGAAGVGGKGGDGDWGCGGGGGGAGVTGGIGGKGGDGFIIVGNF